MVFLIQRAQNKDTLALHLKLNEVVAAIKGASNRLIDVEYLREAEVRRLHGRYRQLAGAIQSDPSEIKRTHTVEEDELCGHARDGAKGTGASAECSQPPPCEAKGPARPPAPRDTITI